MTGQRTLPHMSVRMEDGLVKTIEIDGQRIKGVRTISFTADATGGYPPTVTLELWATVELNGLVAVMARQDRHIQRCTRPHTDEDGTNPTPDQKTPQESSSVHFEGVPGERVNHGYDGVPKPYQDQTAKDAVDWATR